MAREVTCTNHCRGCGSHFSSVEAFDIHRQFEDGCDGDWDRRVCVEPADILTRAGQQRLAVKTAVGVCQVSGPSEPQRGVTVWTRPEGLSAASRTRLEGLS